MKIVLRRSEDIKQAVRRFRKVCERDGILKEIRRRSYYETPSEERSRTKRRWKKDREKAREEAALEKRSNK